MDKETKRRLIISIAIAISLLLIGEVIIGLLNIPLLFSDAGWIKVLVAVGKAMLRATLWIITFVIVMIIWVAYWLKHLSKRKKNILNDIDCLKFDNPSRYVLAGDKIEDKNIIDIPFEDILEKK